MLNSQIARISEYGSNPNNPSGLSQDLKQPFKIIAQTTAPNPAFGTYGDYVINTTTGDFFYKNFNGVWSVIYNFNTGGGGGGVQDIENLGFGQQVFSGTIGGTAYFRTLLGQTGELLINQDVSDLTISMNPSYKPSTLSNVQNFPLQGGLGVGATSPDGVFGSASGFNKGSLFVEIGSPNKIYVCTDPATNSWSLFTQILSMSNYSGQGQVLEAITFGGVARLRAIDGTSEQIAVSESSTAITLSMDNNYKPLTLNKVDNVKNSYTGSAVPPSVAEDSTKGYQVGSIYTQNATFPIGPHLWICADATPGAAVWRDISVSPTVLSFDYINWRNDNSYVHTITGGIQDWNAGPTVLTEASLDSTIWTTSFDGTRQIFTKGTTNATKAYHIDFSMVLSDLLGARTDQKHYTVFMVRKSDGFIYRNSTCLAQTPPTTLPNAWSSVSHGFIIKETTLSPVSYYFRIAGDAGHNFNLERWSIAIHEI